MAVRNIKLTLEYDGTRYHGWQSSKKSSSVPTVSGKLTEVLTRMSGEEIVLFCGEKTDTNVHARRQTANFKTACTLSSEEIRRYLNHYLPLDISVLSVEDVAERFHAEFHALSRIYRYRIYSAPVSDVFRRKYAEHRTDLPDVEVMRKAASFLLGSHDFRAFSSGKTKKSTIRELLRVEFITAPSEVSHDCPDTASGTASFFDGAAPHTSEMDIILEADSFLKQMPQRIIGTLLEIGYKVRKPEDILNIFDGSSDAASACCPLALYLEEIRYFDPTI